LKYLEGNFLLLQDFLKDQLPGIRVSPLEATYLAWINFSALGLDDKELMKLMVKDAGLALLDGPRFGAGGSQYLRMNIAAPRSVVERALNQMLQAFREIFPGKF
jgi:cystathionine beta-lyase